MIDERDIFARFHSAFEVQPPPGAAQRLRSAILEGSDQPHAGAHFPADRSSRISAHLRHPAQDQLRHRWALALVAAVLAVAIVVTLVFSAHALRPKATVPAGPNPPKGQRGTAVVGISGSWFYSANDAALEIRASGPGTQLLITHDGGRTWLASTMHLGLSIFTVVKWIDSKNIVGASVDRAETTNDGGVHWQSIQMSPNLDPEYSSFLTTREGWIVDVFDNSVYDTVDSGALWQKLATLGPHPTSPLGVVFTDADHGFVGGDSQDGIGRLFVTADGGHTWRLIRLATPPGGWRPGDNVVGPPTMFGEQGVLVDQESLSPSSSGRAFAYTTTDGGLTWTNPRLLPSTPASGYDPNLFSNSNYVLTPAEWWLIGQGGQVFRTTDAGGSWQRIQTNVGSPLLSIAPVGGQVLWGMIGGGGSGGCCPYFPVRSTDDGAHWSFVELPASIK